MDKNSKEKIKDLDKLSHLNVNFELLGDATEVDEARFTKVKVWIAHTGKNKNKSYFSKEILESMIPSLKYIPIVGFILAGEDNETDFAGHEERYVITVDGLEIEYLGRMYGFIPEENNARFETKVAEDGIEREYLVADGIIVNKFAKAKEILDRDEVKGQSMELFRDTFDGYYEKINDQFVVTSADFEALCILGDDRIPAMAGGSIEKTQFTMIKYELQTLVEEVKDFYAMQYESLKTNDEKEKGGKVLDIKVLEELITNYEHVSEEFVNGLKDKLDTYETKEALKEVLDAEEATQFALTAGASMNLLASTISGMESYKDKWGDDRKRYSLKDANLELNEVYVVDYMDYMDYGFAFTKEGDRFIIDADSKFAIAWQPVRLEEGMATNFSIAEEAKNAFELVESKIELAKEEITKDFEAKIETQKTEYEATLSDKEEELSRLREFETSVKEKEKTDFVESVENLEDSEKEELIGNISSFTLEELSDEVAKIIGKKNLKFSKVVEKPVVDNFTPINRQNDSDSKSYDYLFKSQ